MRSVTTLALTLSSFQQGEANKIVEFFTQELGRVRAVAHGARKFKSRFGAAHEAGTLLKVVLSLGRSKNLLTIRESAIIDPFVHLKENLEGLSALQEFLKIVRSITFYNAPDDTLFTKIVSLLRIFDGRDVTAQLFSLYMRILALETLGALPDWFFCSCCHLEETSGWYITSYGLFCEKCVSMQQGIVRPVSLEILKILNRISSFETIGRDNLVVSSAQYTTVIEILDLLLNERIRVDITEKNKHYRRTGLTT